MAKGSPTFTTNGRTIAESVLTPRMLHLLELAAEGRVYDDIAEEMGISVHTVGREFCLINQALGADNGRHAVSIAVRRGLLKLGPPLDSQHGHEQAAKLLVAEADRVQDQKVHKPLPVDNPERCLALLMEEVGEVAGEIQKRNPDRVQHELVQVGAIVVQWLARLSATNTTKIEETGD